MSLAGVQAVALDLDDTLTDWPTDCTSGCSTAGWSPTRAYRKPDPRAFASLVAAGGVARSLERSVVTS